MGLHKGIKERMRTGLLPIIYALIAGGFIGFIFNQLFFEINVRTEEQLRLKRELVIEQYQELQRMRQFVDLGLRKRIFIFKQTTVFLNSSDSTFIKDTTFTIGDIRIASVASDSLLIIEWKMLAKKITEERDRIDFSAYRQFQKIVGFIRKHPWPTDISQPSYLKLKASEWSNKGINKKWSSLNKD